MQKLNWTDKQRTMDAGARRLQSEIMNAQKYLSTRSRRTTWRQIDLSSRPRKWLGNDGAVRGGHEVDEVWPADNDRQGPSGVVVCSSTAKDTRWVAVEQSRSVWRHRLAPVIADLGVTRVRMTGDAAGDCGAWKTRRTGAAVVDDCGGLGWSVAAAGGDGGMNQESASTARTAGLSPNSHMNIRRISSCIRYITSAISPSFFIHSICHVYWNELRHNTNSLLLTIFPCLTTPLSG